MIFRVSYCLIPVFYIAFSFSFLKKANAFQIENDAILVSNVIAEFKNITGSKSDRLYLQESIESMQVEPKLRTRYMIPRDEIVVAAFDNDGSPFYEDFSYGHVYTNVALYIVSHYRSDPIRISYQYLSNKCDMNEWTSEYVVIRNRYNAKTWHLSVQNTYLLPHLLSVLVEDVAYIFSSERKRMLKAEQKRATLRRQQEMMQRIRQEEKERIDLEEANKYYQLKDYREALDVYKKHQSSKFYPDIVNTRLGHLYYNGLGVIEDKNTALKYYIKVKNPDYYVNRNLGKIYYQQEKSGEQAYKYLLSATKFKEVESEVKEMLGDLRLGRGKSKNHFNPDFNKEALYWYNRASESGSADVELKIGKMYYYGNDIYMGLFDTPEKDILTARKWLGSAVSKGNAEAEYYLGETYDSYYIDEEKYGEYINLTKAKQHYENAISKGVNITNIEKSLRRVEVQLMSGITWWFHRYVLERSLWD